MELFIEKERKKENEVCQFRKTYLLELVNGGQGSIFFSPPAYRNRLICYVGCPL